MNAIGWQIGAVLFGSSFLIVAIYIAKVLNSTNKVIEKANRMLDVNERHITDIIDNTASITKNVKDITDIIGKVASILRVFKFFKR